MTRIVSAWLAVLCLFATVPLRRSPSAAQCCGTEQCSGDFNSLLRTSPFPVRQGVSPHDIGVSVRMR